MHHTRHPLLRRAREIAAQLEWEQSACDVCHGRGVLGAAGQGSRARGDEPEPCPGCLGVSYVWLDPRRAVFHVEELIEEHERQRGGDSGARRAEARLPE